MRVVGLVGEIKPLTTRTGKRMAVVVLEDLSGRIECTVFPDAYEAARALLVPSSWSWRADGSRCARIAGSSCCCRRCAAWEEAPAARPALHLEVRAEQLSVGLAEHRRGAVRASGRGRGLSPHREPDRSRQAMRSRRYRVAEGDERDRGLCAGASRSSGRVGAGPRHDELARLREAGPRAGAEDPGASRPRGRARARRRGRARDLEQKADTLAPRDLRQPDRPTSGSSSRATRGGPTRSTTSSAASPTSPSCTATASSATTRRSSAGFARSTSGRSW